MSREPGDPTNASARRPARQARGLGRGLGALIPSSTSQSYSQDGGVQEDLGSLLRVPVDDIMPNPRQPRASPAPDRLAELADSIRQHGVIQPLIITRSRPTDPVPYQLIAGERRWRAAQLAGLAVVPALLQEATPQQLLELALVENIQRSDLNPLEEAAAYQALLTDFGLTQAEVAERVGRSRVAVANHVRLLRLPDQAKELLASGALSEGHARALLSLPDEENMLRAAEQVVTRELTVRQTEDLVRRLLAPRQAPQPEPEPEDETQPSQTRSLEEAFRNALGTKVSLQRGKQGGRLIIHFYSDEELQSIFEQIIGKE